MPTLRVSYALLVCLVAFSSSGGAIPFDRWCHEVGGYHAKANRELPEACYCLNGGSVSKPGERCKIVSEDRFCKNPADYLCQSTPTEREITAASDYEQAKRDARTKNEALIHFVRRWGDKKVRAIQEGRWEVLSPEEREAVFTRMNEYLFDNYFLKNGREKKAEQLFERAKTTMLNFLDRKLETEKRPGARKTLEKMRDEVKKATFVFGWSGQTPDGLIPHNLAAQTEHVPKVFRLPGTARTTTKNTIIIGAMIQQIDYAPESFYFNLLHEFSHFIDPRIYPVELNEEKNHPYALELECLRAHDSIGAKPANTKQGQADQLAEAFADWHAMRAWTYENREALKTESGRYKGNGHTKRQYQNPFGGPEPVWGIDTSVTRSHILGRLEELNATYCADFRSYEQACQIDRDNNRDCHPVGRDRVNSLTASPALKKALGCSDNYIREIQDARADAPQDGITAYCGDALYVGQTVDARRAKGELEYPVFRTKVPPPRKK